MPFELTARYVSVLTASVASDYAIRQLLIPSVLIVMLVSHAAAAQIPDQPSASVSGTVLDDNGSVHKCRIEILKVEIEEGAERLVPKCITEVDQRGRYHCGGMFPGSYIIIAYPEDRRAAHHRAKQAPQSLGVPRLVFYPGTTDMRELSTIVLRPNDSYTCDFTLPIVKTSSISGRIADAAIGTSVILLTTDGEHLLPAGASVRSTSKTGTFLFAHVADGDYVVSAESFENGTEYRGMKAIQVGGRDVRGVTITTQPDVTVSGRLSPFPGMRVRGLKLLLHSTNSEISDASASVRDDGSFKFRMVPVGKYCLEAPELRHLYIESISVGNTANTGCLVGVTRDENISVNLDGPASSIRGSVNRTFSEAHQFVILTRCENTGELWVTRTDSWGDFAVYGLAPGLYRLSAWQSLKGVEYKNSAAMKGREKSDVEILIGGGDDVNGVELLPSSR